MWSRIGFYIISLLIVCLLFGDANPRQSLNISHEKAAALDYDNWPASVGGTAIDVPGTRIRVVWILHDYVPFVNAGSEICAHTMNRHLLKKPYLYDVWVGAPGYPNKTYEGVRCFNLYDTHTLFDVLKHAHILMSHSYYYRQQALWISKTFGVPFVEWIHTDNYVRAVGPQWYDTKIKGRQWTVFNSESLKASRPDLPRESIRIVRPPVDYRDYCLDAQIHEEPDKEQKTKTKTNTNTNTKTKETFGRKGYITLSNVNENKGGQLLIQLAKAMPECEFLGIKGGYRKQITDTSLPNLRYIEHTTQIKDVYAQTWVLIMPSKEETWGRTAVEAMSSGIPIIVSPTPGLKECCGDAALYCERTDLRHWIQTIRKLKDDKEFYNQRSALSLQRARALDPTEELNNLEHWIQHDVLKSAVHTDRACSSWEQSMLFR
jgi:glycosyltransferase involved in cell wall biosynthesis